MQSNPREAILNRLVHAVSPGITHTAMHALLRDVAGWNSDYPQDSITYAEVLARRAATPS